MIIDLFDKSQLPKAPVPGRLAQAGSGNGGAGGLSYAGADGKFFYPADGQISAWVLPGATGTETVIGELPAGVYVKNVRIQSTVAFSGGGASTATISVGFSGSATAYATATNVFDAAGIETVTLGSSAGYSGTARQVIATLTCNGTTTAGRAIVIVEFAPVPVQPA
jgi:hypothetical protein